MNERFHSQAGNPETPEQTELRIKARASREVAKLYARFAMEAEYPSACVGYGDDGELDPDDIDTEARITFMRQMDISPEDADTFVEEIKTAINNSPGDTLFERAATYEGTLSNNT